jgi:hypothetical protein
MSNPTIAVTPPDPNVNVDPSGVVVDTSGSTARRASARPNEDQNASSGTTVQKVSQKVKRSYQEVPTIEEYERKSNLNSKELKYIKRHFSNPHGIEPNSNYYFLALHFLVDGFDFKYLTADIAPGQEKAFIDEAFIHDMKLLLNDQKASKFIKKTPAYQKGAFRESGSYGVTHGVHGPNQPVSPITGASSWGPSLVTDLLDSIHPNATQELVNFCNTIRTRAWMSMPKGSFGSLGRMIARINGVIEAFETLVSDVYQGCIVLVQKLYAVINGIIAKVQKQLLSIINKIIPLDLLCLILETIQVILDDINFFTSLFQMSGPFLSYLNTFQGFINTASSWVSNPFSQIQAFMPPEVQNIIDLVNQIGSDPNGYLADMLNNYQYGYVLTALQGNFLGALVNKFGPQYAAITPLNDALTKGTAIYSRFGGKWPDFPATQGPSRYISANGTRVDANGNPLTNLFDVVSSDFNQLGDAAKDLGKLPEDAVQIFRDLGDSIQNIFSPNK